MCPHPPTRTTLRPPELWAAATHPVPAIRVTPGPSMKAPVTAVSQSFTTRSPRLSAWSSPTALIDLMAIAPFMVSIVLGRVQPREPEARLQAACPPPNPRLSSAPSKARFSEASASPSPCCGSSSAPRAHTKDVTLRVAEHARRPRPTAVEARIEPRGTPLSSLGYAASTYLPGFMIPSGSKILLISFMSLSASFPSWASSCSLRSFAFWTPTPCSPVTEPPMPIP